MENYVRFAFGIGRDLFVLGPHVLYHSPDAGKEWTYSTPGGDAIWGASIDELWIAGSRGVLRSNDGNATWTSVNVPTTVELGMVGGRANEVIVGGIGALFRSTDHGATWAPIPHGIASPRFMAMAVDGEGTWIVGREQVKDAASPIGYHTEAILLHSSRGGPFVRLAAPKPGMTDNEESRGICFTASGKLFLAMSYSVYASDDRGATWKRAVDVGTEVLGLACQGREVMASARNKRFVHSTDDGASFGDHELDAVLGPELIALTSVWMGPDGTALVVGESNSELAGGTLLVRSRR